jgi:beta-N-acetylhexosaminidase
MDINEIGQLFITGISGLSLTVDEKDFLQNNNIGGVILFSNNYDNPAQLAELVNEIQKLRDEYPLFISVDQEGGRVKRFKKNFTQFPSMFEVAKHDSPKLTFEVHRILAEELSACGINVDYSPCCDIWTNPKNNVIGDRSFGTEKEIVEKHVSAAIRGLHAGSVLACAKHFPGHGDTLKDSHYDLPYVTKSKEDLEALELIPFVKASKSRVEFMMMAHLVVDAIDKELPTSLSPKAYAYLRDFLKFKKIIITDDMEMKAIADKYSSGEAAVMALKAGADVVLYRSMDTAKEAYAAVKEAVKFQKLKKDIIGEKIRRVLNCKKTHFQEYKPIYIPSLEKLIPSPKPTQMLDQLSLEE